MTRKSVSPDGGSIASQLCIVALQTIVCPAAYELQDVFPQWTFPRTSLLLKNSVPNAAMRFAEWTVITCHQASLPCLKSLLDAQSAPALRLRSPSLKHHPSNLVSQLSDPWEQQILRLRDNPSGPGKTSLPFVSLSALRSLEFNASWCWGLCLAYFHMCTSKVAVTASLSLYC